MAGVWFVQKSDVLAKIERRINLWEDRTSRRINAVHDDVATKVVRNKIDPMVRIGRNVKRRRASELYRQVH